MKRMALGVLLLLGWGLTMVMCIRVHLDLAEPPTPDWDPAVGATTFSAVLGLPGVMFFIWGWRRRIPRGWVLGYTEPSGYCGYCKRYTEPLYVFRTVDSMSHAGRCRRCRTKLND